MEIGTALAALDNASVTRHVNTKSVLRWIVAEDMRSNSWLMFKIALDLR
jgi:hypothetical protein